MTTEELISDLRNYSASSNLAAADRLEELQRDLKQAIAERTPHDYGLLKGQVEDLRRELSESIRERNKTVADLIKQRDEAIASARPEPSRLKIAAMMLAALASRESGTWEAKQEAIWAIEQADELIALAKEVK